MKNIAIFAAFAAFACCFAAEISKEPYRTYDEAVKDILPPCQSGAATHWLTYSKTRGGRISGQSVRILTSGGYWRVSSRTLWSKNRVGTVIALPCGDFIDEGSFKYFANDDSGVMKVMRGKKVGVKVLVSYPNARKPPTETTCHQMVKNLIESGAQIPSSEGRPCRIVGVKRTAMARYGASSVKVDYGDSTNGVVHLVLRDCRPERANKQYIPAVSEGAVADLKSGKIITAEHKRNTGYSSEEIKSMMEQPAKRKNDCPRPPYRTL